MIFYSNILILINYAILINNVTHYDLNIINHYIFILTI
jgi:hypothetical protein